jgi:sugar lactone lactonase YvrE
MRRHCYFLLSNLCFAFIIFLQSCSKGDDNTPSVTSIFPTSGWEGDTVTVYGKNFTGDVSLLDVKVNGKQLTIIQSSPDSIKVKVPGKLGSGPLQVSFGGATYIGPEFTYTYRPTVTTLAGTGAAGLNDGNGSNAEFWAPWGMAMDAFGNIYVADVYNVRIRKISVPDYTVSTIPITASPFYTPYNLAVDKANNIYVTDFNNHILKIAASGKQSVIYNDANLVGAGIAVDANNNLFVANNTKHLILKMTTEGANAATFASPIITPRNIFFGKDGTMYVSSVGINKVSTTGSISLVATDPGFQGWETAIDTAGNFYSADYFGNRIRKIDKKGIVTTIAGNGTAADVDGIGIAASFNGPRGIIIDEEGNLFVTTYIDANNSGNKVRKISFD